MIENWGEVIVRKGSVFLSRKMAGYSYDYHQ